MTLESLSLILSEPNNYDHVFNWFKNILRLVETYNSALKFTSKIDREMIWRLLTHGVRDSEYEVDTRQRIRNTNLKG